MTRVTADAAPRRSVNLLAVASIVFGVISAAAMFGFGIAVLAVFAVGAGHVAIQQIRARGQRGLILARIGLVIGYLLAVYGLVATIIYTLVLTGRSQG